MADGENWKERKNIAPMGYSPSQTEIAGATIVNSIQQHKMKPHIACSCIIYNTANTVEQRYQITRTWIGQMPNAPHTRTQTHTMPPLHNVTSLTHKLKVITGVEDHTLTHVKCSHTCKLPHHLNAKATNVCTTSTFLVFTMWLDRFCTYLLPIKKYWQQGYQL